MCVNRTGRLIKSLGSDIVSGAGVNDTDTRAFEHCGRVGELVPGGEGRVVERFIALATLSLSRARVSVQNQCRRDRSGLASKTVRLTCRILAKTRPAPINHTAATVVAVAFGRYDNNNIIIVMLLADNPRLRIFTEKQYDRKKKNNTAPV